MEQKLSRLLLPAFLVYVCCVLYGATIHESWADEAQSWLIARDASLSQLFKLLPSEGHPPLWYLILMPFAKLGAPYVTVKYIAACFCIGAMFLLMFKTEVSPYLKLTFPFTYFVLYQYAVFGRSYALVIFFMIAVVALYRRRFEQPWLFALAVIGLFNTHILFFSFTFCIVLLFIIDALQEKKLNVMTGGAALLMLAGGLYLLPYLGSSQMAHYFTSTSTDHVKNVRNMLALSLIIPKVMAEHGLLKFNIPNINLGVILFTILLILLSVRSKALALFIGGAAGILYIAGYKYAFIQPRHFGMLFLSISGAYFIASYYKEDKFNFIKVKKVDPAKIGTILLALIFLLQMPLTFYNYKIDAAQIYSGGEDAAEFLMDNNMEHQIIVGHKAWAVLAVLPYLPKDVRFYNLLDDKFHSYYEYDSAFFKDPGFNLQNSIVIPYEKYKDSLRRVLLLFNYQIDLNTVPFLDLVYKTPESPLYNQEDYRMYKFKEQYIVADSTYRAYKADSTKRAQAAQKQQPNGPKP